MRLFRDASIRAKLDLLTGTSVLLALALTCVAFAVHDIRELRRNRLQHSRTLAEVLGTSAADALISGDRDAARKVLAALRYEPSIEAAALYDAQGALFAVFAEQASPPSAARRAGAEPMRLDRLEYVHIVPDPANGQRPLGAIYVRSSLAEIKHETRQHLAIATVVLGAALSVAMVISWRIQRLIVAPIHRLVAAAQHITEEGDYSHRVEKHGCDEHGALCDAFNAMLDRVEAARRELRQAHDELEERVTERTAQLRHAVELAEAASRAKSDFLANMSHEIRTPMSAVLGYADLLVEEDDISPAGRERIETIRRNGRRLMTVINDILDVSKIEAGKMTVERIDCSVCRTLADVVSLWRGKAGEKGLTLEVEYRGRIPDRVRTDPTRLHQVLSNLVANAVKFTERGGIRVVVSLGDTTPESPPRLKFEVIDTGPGMTPEQMAKVFQAFTQGDETMTRRFGGTGLGLTIARGLTELLGGEIHVASEPGRGSRFTVTIDAGSLEGARMIADCRESILASEPVAAAPAVRLTGRILLVEDGLDNQRLISFLLRRAGAEVTVAENGQEGLDAALTALGEGRTFDVILMDMQMPILDGYAATARLRAGGYRGPIVALTAHAMSHDRQKCLDAGCDDYLAKPIEKHALLERVSQLMPPSHVAVEVPAASS
jgi:signal transduction histidine kinase/ActR/RegA family two-component response regulator